MPIDTNIIEKLAKIFNKNVKVNGNNNNFGVILGLDAKEAQELLDKNGC